jgi:hypothetical protein
MEFEDLVELDLFGKCNEQQEIQLDNELERWRDELVCRLKELDSLFFDLKTSSAGTPAAKTDYFTWKSKAIGRKLAIVNRLQDVKLMIKDASIEASDTEAKKTKDEKITMSISNMGQMATLILSANIRAGTKNPVNRTLIQVTTLCRGLSAGIRDQADQGVQNG